MNEGAFQRTPKLSIAAHEGGDPGAGRCPFGGRHNCMPPTLSSWHTASISCPCWCGVCHFFARERAAALRMRISMLPFTYGTFSETCPRMFQDRTKNAWFQLSKASDKLLFTRMCALPSILDRKPAFICPSSPSARCW